VRALCSKLQPAGNALVWRCRRLTCIFHTKRPINADCCRRSLRGAVVRMLVRRSGGPVAEAPPLATLRILQVQCAQLARVDERRATGDEAIKMPASLAMSDIRTVDPLSSSNRIASQSQLLPSLWPVMRAKRPLIPALGVALAPTHRPERLQEK
jgi:hypothetical protein